MRILSVLSVLFLLLTVTTSCSKEGNEPNAGGEKAVVEKSPAPLEYVGSAKCAQCHKKEYELWLGSDHQLAMQEASDQTILGDFNDSTFVYNGIRSEFFKRDDSFCVRTDGPDGTLQDYEVRYVFGIRPLQQYLIEFPGGRYQALSIVWDTRSKEEGGQRWFHLYPDEKIDHKDVLHWTGLYQNWNHMCADCHSTDVKKNYNAAEDRYATSWSEINVSCESCHGPGSRHLAWAESGNPSSTNDNSLTVTLKPSRQEWQVDEKTGTAIRRPVRKESAQVETCAPCHSRRSQLTDRRSPGDLLTDAYLPSLLQEPLYYVDGQIRDEVYEYASFLQSQMFAQGVECSHCHDPHSQKLRASGNLLCAQCHLPAKYDTPSHHFHKPESKGAHCIECHMPQEYYMVVDGRRDHSFRVPRPDLSEKLGTPNACSQCHLDQPASWAAQATAKWYGTERPAHYGEIFHEARNYQIGAERKLVKIAQDQNIPVMVRAAATRELANYPGAFTLNALVGLAREDSSLIRLGVLDALVAFPADARWATASHLLQDPRLSVRVRAAGTLSERPEGGSAKTNESSFQKAQDEFVQVQQFNSDRPESHLNLGNRFVADGNYEKAETEYLTALRIQPSMIQGYVNLADLYRVWGKDDRGWMQLHTALALEPENAEVNHAMGLLLVRQQKLTEALPHLKKAARNSDSNPYYAYVYAVALNSAGQSKRAISELQEAHSRFPVVQEILVALIHFCRDSGNIPAARSYAEELLRNSPDDPVATRLLQELGR